MWTANLRGTGTKLPLDGTAKNPDRCQRSLPGGKREIYGLFRDKSERMRAFFESTHAPGGRGSGIDGFQEEKEAKSGIFGRGSDFVGRISEIRRTSPRKKSDESAGNLDFPFGIFREVPDLCAKKTDLGYGFSWIMHPLSLRIGRA